MTDNERDSDDEPRTEAASGDGIRRGWDDSGRERQVTGGGFDAGFFQQVVAEAGVGVGVYDDSGRFVYVNEAYADLLGYEVDELQGRPVWAVNPTVEAERFDRYWDSFGPGETRQTETVHERADGSELPVETHTTAVDIDGERYHVGTIADVTDRVEGWRELERQNERLEQFASVVSHDLRNPLNVAMGRIRLVAEEHESEHVDAVENALERMEELVDDVLSLAREGQRLTEPEPVSLREAVTAAWQTTGVEDATLDVADDLGVVQSDESRLCEIFENLFRNAVEHGSTSPDSASTQADTVERCSTSPDSQARQDAPGANSGEPSGAEGPADADEHGESGVTIRVGLLDEGGFYVADDGPGIDPDVREDVFEHGYSTNPRGTGFGLTIVEEIADAHGWDVRVTESDSGGARFEFTGVEIE